MSTISDFVQMYWHVKGAVGIFGASKEFTEEFNSRKEALGLLILEELGLSIDEVHGYADTDLGPCAEAKYQMMKVWLHKHDIRVFDSEISY